MLSARAIETALGCAIAAIGAFFAVASWRLPASHDPSAPGPGFAPGGLGLLLILLGAALAVSVLAKPALEGAPAAPTSEEAVGRRKIAIATALLAACVMLFEPLGFLLSTFLFLSAGFVFLGEVSWRVSAPAAAFAAMSLWLFFTKLMGVGLPYGLIAEILFR
jgi:putative tricarboxylic transport membrane protein